MSTVEIPWLRRQEPDEKDWLFSAGDFDYDDLQSPGQVRKAQRVVRDIASRLKEQGHVRQPRKRKLDLNRLRLFPNLDEALDFEAQFQPALTQRQRVILKMQTLIAGASYFPIYDKKAKVFIPTVTFHPGAPLVGYDTALAHELTHVAQDGLGLLRQYTFWSKLRQLGLGVQFGGIAALAGFQEWSPSKPEWQGVGENAIAALSALAFVGNVVGVIQYLQEPQEKVAFEMQRLVKRVR